MAILTMHLDIKQTAFEINRVHQIRIEIWCNGVNVLASTASKLHPKR